MGRYSPSQKPGALLQSVALVVTTGPSQVVTSGNIVPAGTVKWNVTGFSCDAPAGTDGALFWYKGSAAAANLLAVTPIGEKTSDYLPIPFALDSSSPIVVSVTGAQNGTVTVNVTGTTG